ncbi:hypothetical protein P0F65_22320 [Sphingomonas sp. I4]
MSQAMGTAWDGRAAMSVAAPDMLGRIALAVALVLCCLPYLVFGPIAAPSQVQPWAALLCWAFLVHRLLTATLRVTGFHLLVLCFALWFMLYVSEPGSVGLDYYLRRSASFVICWAILVAATYVSPSLLWRVLAFTLPLWTMFALLGFVSKGLIWPSRARWFRLLAASSEDVAPPAWRRKPPISALPWRSCCC